MIFIFLSRFSHYILQRIDISFQKPPLGRWQNVGKSCDLILNKKINTKYRTLLKKKVYNNTIKNN
jgi:hypothetical protein